MHSKVSSPEVAVSTEPSVALDVTIPSDVGEIERLVRQVTERCQALQVSSRLSAFNIPVALTEALANAILRGNRDLANATVRLRMAISTDTVVFDVIDHGPGFDLATNTREPSDDDVEREDGRGLFLMRELMDTVEQFHEPDDGNVVRMTIHR